MTRRKLLGTAALAMLAQGGCVPTPAAGGRGDGPGGGEGNSPGAGPEGTPPAAAGTGFGLELFRQLVGSSPGENTVLSPWSMRLALAMTYNGAGGETERAMAAVLGYAGLSLEEVNRGNAALRESLAAPQAKVEWSDANSLWVGAGEQFRPDFVGRCEAAYEAALARLDFSDPGAAARINAWVSERTRGRIAEMVTPEDLLAAVAVLLNAAYFKGAWARPFDAGQTREAEFTLSGGARRKVPMMTRAGGGLYQQGAGFQAVALPYAGERLRMCLFLPDRQAPLAEFAGRLNGPEWASWMGGFRPGEGTVSLPRFKIAYEQEMKPALTALGMGIAFEPRADFSRMMSPPVWIDRVRHKTFLEVNEEGTEAAASTAVIMTRGRPEGFHVVFDRPFLCAVHDTATGALLFLGAIEKPA